MREVSGYGSESPAGSVDPPGVRSGVGGVMSAEVLPPVPRFDVPKALRLRNLLLDRDLLSFYGCRPVGAGFDELAEAIATRLKIEPAVVRQSVADLAGELLTAERLKATVWRLAGNLHLLKAGQPVPPWSGIAKPGDWCAVQVMSVVPEPEARKPSVRVAYKVLAGRPCPLDDSAVWSFGYARMAARQLGFTSARRARPFRSVYELTSLRLYLLLDPVKTSPSGLRISKVHCPPAAMKWNRRLLDMRQRVDWTCPHGFRHHCFNCPVGYDECPAATHPETKREQASDAADV